MEREIASWLRNLETWIHNHERFTWLTMFLAVTPSPPSAILSLLLSSLQILLCIKGRIPQSEFKLLLLACILSIINLSLTIWAASHLISHGWSYWQTMDPFFWLRWLWLRLKSVEVTQI